MVLWQPLIEELLFRGFLQGELNRRFHARRFVGKISVANCITTLLFCAVHVLHQSVALAVAVAIPSLLFGYFRERHQSIYSAIFLHAVYNALFLAVGR
jgi:membrane protease YdiL (CAAX protease family)